MQLKVEAQCYFAILCLAALESNINSSIFRNRTRRKEMLSEISVYFSHIGILCEQL